VIAKFNQKQSFGRLQVLGGFIVMVAIIWMISASSPSQAASTVALSDIDGTWSGSGWAVRHEGGARENVRCRLKANYKSRARKLTLSGKCAASSGTYTLLGHIADHPGSNRVTGRWVNPRGIGAVKIAGQRTNNRLTFFFNGKDERTERKVTYKTVWKLGNDRFSLSTGTRAGADDALGTIVFKR